MRFPSHHLAAFLAFTVAALHPNQKPIQLLHPSNQTIPRSLFNDLEELARIVDITYCVGTTDIQSPFLCLSRCTDFPTFELIQTWNTGPLMSDSSGYMAYDHDPKNKRILVAFRGTYSIANTIADLSAMPQRYVPYLPDDGDDESTQTTLADATPDKCDNCNVHAGFLSSWKHARDVIMPALREAHATHPDYALHLVGHSLGGAVALLASLEMQSMHWDPTVTTFGEPRVGNEQFVAHVHARFEADKFRRVTHVDDPVTLLPPSTLGYRSHGHEIYISRRELPPALDDVRTCEGDEDSECSAGGNGSKLWELFFSHRDYFWRLGVCVRGGDPWDWKGSYRDGDDEL